MLQLGANMGANDASCQGTRATNRAKKQRPYYFFEKIMGISLLVFMSREMSTDTSVPNYIVKIVHTVKKQA